MTETEARTKVCKIGGIIQAIFTVAAATIRGDTGELEEKINAIGFCCASDCMMWRWKAVIESIFEKTVPSRNHGYCGLGGKP